MDKNFGLKRKSEGYTCDICNKRIKHKGNFERHLKGHKTRFSCSLCNRSFNREDSFNRHRRGHEHGYKKPVVKYTCEHCDISFSDCNDLYNHVQSAHRCSQTGGNNATHTHRFIDKSSIRKKANDQLIVNQRFLYPNDDDKHDLLKFFANTRHEIKQHLKDRVAELRHIKWYIVAHVLLRRESNIGEIETSEPYFHSGSSIMLSREYQLLEHNLNEGFQSIFKAFDEYIRKGSGWTLEKIISVNIHTIEYKPIGGSSYMELPRSIRHTGGIINIQNTDQKCFLWSIIASLHPANTHPERVNQYRKYEGELNMTGINYPVPVSSVPKFEKQNNISVNIFSFEEDQYFPMYISPVRQAGHEVNLLFLQDEEEKTHYCFIKNLNRMLAKTKTKKHNHHFCRYCLQGFQKKHTLQKHLKYCSSHNAQSTTLPEKGVDDILQFKDFHKQLRVPFVIYADFEAFAQQLDCASEETILTNNTKSIFKYEACGYGYQVVSVDEEYTKEPVIYRGENASEHFLRSIMEEEEEIKDILKQMEPMEMSDEEQKQFELSTHCHICGNALKHSSKVRDHCHVSGKFRGAACRHCNLNFKNPKFIPVIFHNLKNFDAHILCQAIGIFKDEDITCIPNNMEKYVSFSLGNLRFIDSFQFIDCSLSEMVENLKSEGTSVFKNFCREFPDAKERELLLRKGVYPYEYVDKPSKFCETKLPPKDSFYSNLMKSHISQDDYDHVQKVWNKLGINNIGEYHDLYLKTDVLFLTDCFESFRDTCQKHYALDPCHFYTSPGLAWSAALKMTRCKLELLTDPDMYLFFEEGVRGGISVVSHRYAKANNEHVPGYDPNSPKSYIAYLDANNLYGWSMSQYLPEKNFRWMTDQEIQKLDVSHISKKSRKGYVLEVDLEYPPELHSKHNCYPLAPERQSVSNNDLSPYNAKLWKIQHGIPDNNPIENRVITSKLIPSLNDKKNYVLHYHNLKLYLELGMKLSKIHRVLEFDQSPWLKTYISYNTEQRAKAKNKFEKKFFKLMNNSVFGKTMENVRNRVDIRLLHTEEKVLRQTAKSSFKRFNIFNQDLVGVENKKVNLKLNKPIYVGFSTLEISKTFMYAFHYNYIKKKYNDRAKLLFTDTDSLCYLIETRDFYKDIGEEKDSLFDFSEYPKDHWLHDQCNKAVPGYFKDETRGQPIWEFIGLRSKMYSYIYGGNEVKKAKGIGKVTIEKDLKHNQYKQCLFQQTQIMCSINNIQSKNHQLYVMQVKKCGLNAFDDKRYIHDDGISTWAHGHKNIHDN